MRRVFYVLCVVLLCGLNMHAQEAQLSGLITDPTGAVVPQASVALRNQDTGVKYQTESNDDGLYMFPFVKPGIYEVTAEKTGFKTLNRTDIKLDVAQTARIDLTLAVGTVSEQITVQSSGPLLQMESASLGT